MGVPISTAFEDRKTQEDCGVWGQHVSCAGGSLVGIDVQGCKLGIQGLGRTCSQGLLSMRFSKV